MQKKFIILVSLLILIAIPMSFAHDNETVLSDDAASPLSVPINGDVLKASNDYYFNASAETDGDGSANSPYKYLTSDRIKSNCNIYLADGEYELDLSKSIEKVNIYGSNVEKTVIKYNGIGFTVSSSLTVQNVTFTDMSITNYGNIIANNTVFSHGYGSRYDSYGNNFGGAIYSHEDYSNAHVTLNNCTFNNNFAVYGGAIYMGNGYLEIIDTIFNLNMAYNYGGAIACENTKSVIISKSKFYNSISMGDAGGAIYLKNTNFTGRNIEFVNSSATFGSAITSLKSTVSLTGITCENNTAKWDGGAIYHMYGDFSLTGSRFINNSARSGGALYIDNSTSCFLISNLFSNNIASHAGGAIYSILNTLRNPFQVKNTFNNNHAYFADDIFDTSTFNLTIGNGNYTMYRVNPVEIDELPSRYSSIDEGYTTTVKNQESGGNCWAFTAMAVLESCILKAGGDALDLSEENMKNLMALYSDYGWNIDVNEGGYDHMPWAYLTSWLGPVLEKDDLTDDKSALSPILDSVLHVQNILFLKRDNFTDNDAIKRAVMQYGAVGTGIAYYNAYMNSVSYYCYSTMSCNHAVTIVGWDDTYSKSNFKWSGSIGDGAWIVKNSWGPNWGNNGYFYVSYYDMNFARPGDGEASYTIVLNDTIKYDKNYQYDISGKTDYFINTSSSVWYKNVFKATDDEYLSAVSTYFEKVTEWSVSIYVNDGLVLVKEGKSNPGYHTIDLDQLIPLKLGDVFEVVLNINVDGEAGFPISENVKFNKMLYGPEMSYVSYDGENWQDLYDLTWAYSTHTYKSAVACIKAFTVLDEIATNLNLSIAFDGNPAEIIAFVHDEYGNPLKSGRVTFNINEINYVVDVVDGVAVLPYYFSSLQNNIYALFEAEGYVSSMGYDMFSFDKLRLGFDFDIERTLNNVTLNIIAKDRINDDALLFINDDEYPIAFVNGRYSMNLTGLENGIYNVTLKIAFPLDSIYLDDTVNSSFTIDVKSTEIVSDDLSITDDDDVSYIISLFDEDGNPLLNKSVRLIIGKNVYNATTDINGQANISIKLSPGIYEAKIIFEGDNDYWASKDCSNIEVKCRVVVSAEVTQFANNATLSITVSKGINDTIAVVINNKTEHVEVNQGIGSLNMNNLENGIYYIRIGLNETLYSFDEFSTDFVVDVKNTNIVAYDVTVTDENAFNYTIVLFDELGNPLSNKPIEVIIAKNMYGLVTDENGEAIISIKLNPGVYETDIMFMGDNDYFGSESSTTINVKSKVDIDLAVDKYADEVSFTVTLSKRSMGFLTLTINNESESVRFVNGIARYKLSNLENGDYYVSVTLDDPIYAYDDTLANFTVDVRSSQILAGDIIINDEDLINYTVHLVDDDGIALLNKSIDANLNGTYYNLVTDEYGTAVIPISLKPGVYTLNIAFKGDDSYFKSINSSIINVKCKVSIDLSVEQFANNVNIAFNLSKPLNDTLIIVINNETQEINIIDGLTSLNLTGLENDVYNYTVYLNDDIYDYNEINSQFIVDVKKTRIIADDLVIVEGKSGIFNITIVDENNIPLFNRTIEFNLNGDKRTELSDINGHAGISFNLTAGNYDVKTLFGEDNNYLKSDSTNKIKVKAIVDIALGYTSLLDDFIIQLNSSNPMNETLIVKINNMNYTVQISNYTNNLILNKLSNGVYNVTVSLKDTDDFYFENMTSQFVINTLESKIISNDAIVYHDCNTKYSIRLIDVNGKPLGDKLVIFALNDKKTEVWTNSNGWAEFEFKLQVGEYDISIRYSGDSYSYYGCEKTQSISVKTTIIANDSITKTYNSKYAVKLLNGDGNPLANFDIQFIFNDVKGIMSSDAEGYVYFDIMESPGDYVLTVINPVNNETLSKTINVVPRITQNNDLVMYEYGGNYFKVLVLDDNGNAVKAGETVQMRIGSIVRDVKTASNGYASLKISLKSNKYTIVTSYKGYQVSNKITVKPLLITKNIAVKKGKAIKFQAKLINTKGKILINKKITFKFGGKKYFAMTNKKGIATLTLNLNLKVGSYKVYSVYGKSKAVNIIKIKK